PAPGSLKAAAATAPPARRGRYSASCSSVPRRSMVPATICWEVMTLRTELHRLPVCAVSSPISLGLSPSPPNRVATWGHSRPSSAKVRIRLLGRAPCRSHSPAWSPMSLLTRSADFRESSAIGVLHSAAQAVDQVRHGAHGAEVVQLQVAATDGDTVGLFQMDDEFHGEHRGETSVGEQICMGIPGGAGAAFQEGDEFTLNVLAGQIGGGGRLSHARVSVAS